MVFLGYFLMVALVIMAIFMIGLILIQRGRGGGLIGALGGMGGQSAFGAKAGDIFTRVTMYTALIWIVLCAITTRYVSHEPSKFEGITSSVPTSSAGANPDAKSTTPAEKSSDNKYQSPALGRLTFPYTSAVETVELSASFVNT